MTPKEEQKQHLIDMMKDDENLGLYEEAAENKYGLSDQYWKNRIGFVHGAKWQSERMYSDEDINKQIEDFKHDLMESNSHYVKLLCDGAIFGFNRLKSIKL